MKKLWIVTLSFGLGVCSLAFGQEEEGPVVYQKKTVVSFGEDTIDGDLTKPDAVYLESKKRVRHSNLIRIREKFSEQILRSVADL